MITESYLYKDSETLKHILSFSFLLLLTNLQKLGSIYYIPKSYRRSFFANGENSAM